MQGPRDESSEVQDLELWALDLGCQALDLEGQSLQLGN